jgi:hypothetical protein
MTNKFEFLDSLTEARMLRHLSSVKGEDVNAIASKLFSHLLALRILVAEDAEDGKQYASDTLQYSSFKTFKVSMPDLYNLIVLVTKQYEYADTLFNDWALTLPEMRLRRVLRDLASGAKDQNDFNELMLIMQRKLSLSSVQIQTRRAVSDYDELSPSIKAALIRRLLIEMRVDGPQSDLYIALQKAASSKSYA